MLSRISRLTNKEFIHALGFPGYLGFSEDFQGLDKEFPRCLFTLMGYLGLEGGEEEAKRGSGTPTTEQQQKVCLNNVWFFLSFFLLFFGYGP